MKLFWFYFLGFIAFFGCVRTEKVNGSGTDFFETRDQIDIKYAQGFSVDTTNKSFLKIKVNSLDSKYVFSDSIYKFYEDNPLEQSVKKIQNKYQSIAIQSSTHVSYLELLRVDSLIKGLTGKDYLPNLKTLQILNDNHALELGSNGKVDTEKLLSIQPDYFFIFPFELDNTQQYKAMGIETLLVTEYLEKSPLARLEWIKYFGLIFNEYPKSEAIFNNIEQQYLAETKPLDSNRTVFFNLPYKDEWSMPSSNSVTANLIQDAGMNYFYKAEALGDNLIVPKEKVWQDAIDIEYWVITAARPIGFSLNDLKSEVPIYKKFKSVEKGQVIFCNTNETDYFSVGVVEPHIMLQDIVNCLDGHDDQNTYFKLLK